MKSEKTKKQAKTSSKPEKVGAPEALSKMKNFTKRKEQIIADIRASKN